MNYFEAYTESMMECFSENQGEFFEYALREGCDMEDFIGKFMASEFCNRELDSIYSYFQLKPAEMCVPRIENEYPEGFRKLEGIDGRFADVFWVGMMYRRLQWTMEVPSRELVKLIGPHRLDQYQPLYETWPLTDAARDLAGRIRRGETEL